MRRAIGVAGLCAAVMAGPAQAAFNKGQELTILALRSALLAAERCPYAVDDARMRSFLSRKGLSRADLDGGNFSPLLQEDLAADAERYGADTAAACEQAWASYGPDGPMTGILRRR